MLIVTNINGLNQEFDCATLEEFQMDFSDAAASGSFGDSYQNDKTPRQLNAEAKELWDATVAANAAAATATETVAVSVIVSKGLTGAKKDSTGAIA